MSNLKQAGSQSTESGAVSVRKTAVNPLHSKSQSKGISIMFFRNRTKIFLFSVTFFMLGCSHSHNLKYVEGTVTLDGKPIEAVSVSFLPVDPSMGLGAGGYTDTRGKFKLSSLVGKGGDGTQSGKYNVVFVKLAPSREQTEKEKELSKTNPEKITPIPMIDVLPSKYNSPKTSGFEVEIIESGKNVFQFDLVSQ
jgi:hypothetical protein